MVPLIVILAVLLLLTWAYVLFGNRSETAEPKSAPQPEARGGKSEAAPDLAAELDRCKKELTQQRTQLQELKAEVKQAKRKLYEAKEASKNEHDLAKAHAEVERSASAQLEAVRAELGHAEVELSKLRTEVELSKGRGKSPPAAKPAEPPPAPPTAPPQAEVKDASAPAPTRELSRAEREKLERFEHLAHKERGRAVELERDVKRLRSRVETQNRVFLVTKGELDLLREKYKALEKRLNRNLLEKDLMKRALASVDPSGQARTELTEAEIADSDRTVEARLAEEAERPAVVHVRRAPKDAAPEGTEASAGDPVASEPASEAPVALEAPETQDAQPREQAG